MLIATDLDGTLVPNDGTTLPAYTAEVLRRADEAGVPIVFVTARPLRWMDSFWPHVGRHGMAIVSNGAVTYDAGAGEVVHLAGIDPEPGLAIVAAVTTAVPGASFALECLDGMRLDPAFVEPYPVPVGTPRGPLDQVWDVPAVKVLVRYDDEALSPTDFHDAVAAAVDDSATVTWSVAGVAEISAAGVTKASALARLCERLGVAPADVVAFGDMPNDIAMLSWAGTSYAMADAHPSLVEVADHVAPACSEEGVAQVVAGLLAGRAALTGPTGRA
jgi:Cof subfamily protein (haloacid dehalogenase superfamily)